MGQYLWDTENYCINRALPPPRNMPIGWLLYVLNFTLCNPKCECDRLVPHPRYSASLFLDQDHTARTTKNNDYFEDA